MSYLMVESRGGHGVHVYGQYDVHRPVHRWLWVAADGSGLIREIAGPFRFYTPEGKARWQAAGSPALREGQSDDVFRPGELRGTASRLIAGRHDPATAWAVLKARSPVSLHDVSALLGETILRTAVRQATYEAAERLPGVERVAAISDQLGRAGHGLSEVDMNGNRHELIFDAGCELLGYQVTLRNPSWCYAPPGTVISWAAFLAREWVDELPRDAPTPPHR